uniref:Uncharacterized protein n=1 Tax=Anguilla anguilla TaxID=7936 RepID=A0A0E9PBR0_ANGAN
MSSPCPHPHWKGNKIFPELSLNYAFPFSCFCCAQSWGVFEVIFLFSLLLFSTCWEESVGTFPELRAHKRKGADVMLVALNEEEELLPSMLCP